MKGSQKELLQNAVAKAEGEYRAAAAEEERLRLDLKATRDKVATLQQRYDRACVDAAQNVKGDDPVAIAAERDQHSHRIRGLETLHKQAADAHQAASMKLNEAGSALQAQLDAEEEQRLNQAVAEATGERDSAKAAFDAAERARGQAVWARDRFRRELDLKQREQANELRKQQELEALARRRA